jgi:hypothetical protein
MIKRLTWFVGGAVAGVAGSRYTKRKVVAAKEQLAPAHIAKVAATRARERGRDVVDAVREGVEAMRAREAELRARLDEHQEPTLAELEPGARVLVDGRPVEPGKVIVLREVRDEREHRQAPVRRQSRRSPRRA